MWTNDDYDNLMTFGEYLETSEATGLYTGINIDESTIDALKQYFLYRRLVDNGKFFTFYRRALNQAERQYNNYLRIELTDFDPVVSQYLERQINRTGSRATTAEDDSSKTRSGQSGDTTQGSGTARTETENTGTSEGSGTSSTESRDNASSTGSTTTDRVSKHGDTPQAATGAGGSMALDWTYLSAQDQVLEQGSSNNSGTNIGTTSGSTTDSTETTSSGTAETTTTDTTTRSGTHSETETSEGSRSETVSDASEDRERMTGRSEAAQDLLKRARDYITTTNGFLWLCDKLDKCFMQIYDI